MQQVAIDAQVREITGKERNKKLRRKGEVPATLYGKGLQSVNLQVAEKDVRRLMAAGANVVVNLTVKNGKSTNYMAMIQEVQQDHFAKYVLHVDFHQVNLTEKVHATVRLTLKGGAAVEKAGGVVDHVLWETEIVGLVSSIPEEIEVDISGLAVGDSLHLRDVKMPDGIELTSSGDEMVVVIHQPKAAEAVPVAAVAATATPAA